MMELMMERNFNHEGMNPSEPRIPQSGTDGERLKVETEHAEFNHGLHGSHGWEKAEG
jgi:hypothetical protein